MGLPVPDVYGHGPLDRGHAAVVYHDHAFSAGTVLEVGVMAAPHRHTQFEVNHVLDGSMTYSFDGRCATLDGGGTALFFGMLPHQVVACAPDTRFVCLYVPVAVLLGMHLGEGLRRALFAGSFVRGTREFDTDAAAFRRWREDLRTGEGALAAIVRDELGARLRRLEHDGWTDAVVAAPALAQGRRTDGRLSDRVATMTRFIADRCAEGISVGDVARSAGLHPNYAMTLFRATVGMTISDYITRNRLDAAQTLLACSDEDVATVAFSAGFGSLSRFYEAFRRRFGTSPGAFRASLSSGRPDPGRARSRSAPEG